MSELSLKYGCNPNQKDAKVSCTGELPFKVLNGKPGYINLLDALNGWQLVSELASALSLPAAASFKHTSPAGVGIAKPLSPVERAIYFTGEQPLSQISCAYARARGADRMSSFGDFVSLSCECDEACALLIKKEVSDGIIAPSYSPAALQILRAKKSGNYCILQVDPAYQPPLQESRQIFGVTFTQERNCAPITRDLFKNIVTKNKAITPADEENLIIALVTLKYTQSNSVCFAQSGGAIGIGAGQQSRIHCTRLAAQKADTWQLRHCPKVLALPFKDGIKRADRDNAIDVYINGYFDVTSDDVYHQYFATKPAPLTPSEKSDYLSKVTGVALGSDAFFPFGDNIERAAQSGVTVISEPGGSIRDDDVIAACDRHNITMSFSGLRLFYH